MYALLLIPILIAVGVEGPDGVSRSSLFARGALGFSLGTLIGRLFGVIVWRTKSNPVTRAVGSFTGTIGASMMLSTDWAKSLSVLIAIVLGLKVVLHGAITYALELFKELMSSISGKFRTNAALNE